MAWAPDYCTAAELKAFVRVDDTVDDAQVALAVTSASRAVDDYCGRQFGVVTAAEARTYRPWPDYVRGRYVASVDDLQTTDDLVVEVNGTAVTDYDLEPVNAAAKGRPWTMLALPRGSSGCDVVVTAVWGWTAVPVAVKEATLLQGSRLISRRDSPYGVAGSPDQGSELRLLARVDPDVAVALRGYRRMRGPQ